MSLAAGVPRAVTVTCPASRVCDLSGNGRCGTVEGVAENDEIPDGNRHTPRERAIARAASAQHGLVTLAQLRALGLSSSGVRSRVAAGRLNRVRRAVFAVGPAPLSFEARLMAAVLACGPGAVLSHRSAAALWGLRGSTPDAIEVTAPRSRARSHRGIAAHSAGTLRPGDVTRCSGIPCTTVARTLLDLAEFGHRRGVERALDRAEELRLLDLRAVNDVLDHADGRRGAPLLRAVLAEYQAGDALTKSELEECFLEICGRAGVPRPQVNAWLTVGGHAMQVDFMWPAQKIVVETDGYRFHNTRRAFESDRHRDQSVTLAGWTVLRFTWRQVARDPEGVNRALERLFRGIARAMPLTA